MKESELIFALMSAFGKKNYSFTDLSYLSRPFNVSESSLRTNLSRMDKKGEISIKKTGRDALYSFNKKGTSISENVAYSFKKPHWKQWDNSWWGISYSLPHAAKKERYRFRKKLIAYRFALLHGGFWIRPINRNERIDEVFNHQKMSSHYKLIRFQPTADFSIEEIQEAWNIMELHKRFNDTTHMLLTRMEAMGKISPEQALMEKMETGARIVETLFSDPLLPERYLPDNWKGNELRQFFSAWDEKITQVSKPYWIKIFTDKKYSQL